MYTDDLSYNDLTIEERQAYNQYKDNPYELNSKLRLGTTFTELEITWINTLENIIRKCNHQRNITLYRATCSDCVDGFVDEKGIYFNPSFMSTTNTLLKTARHAICDAEYDHVLLEMYCPSGTNMLPMDLNPISGHTENEMLINRNSVWKITDKKVVINLTEIQQLLGPFRARTIKKLIMYRMNFIRYINN